MNIPEGWKLVPVEPTLEQLVRARNWFYKRDGKTRPDKDVADCYAAMLAAVPPMDKAEGVSQVSQEFVDTLIQHGFDYATKGKTIVDALLAVNRNVNRPIPEPRDEREAVAWANVERNGRLHTYHGIKELPVGRHELFLRPTGPSPEAVKVAAELQDWANEHLNTAEERRELRALAARLRGGA